MNMHRRDVLRSLFFRTSTARPIMNSAEPVTAVAKKPRRDTANGFISRWHLLPGTASPGEDLFSLDLQDWRVKDGELYCVKHGRERMVQVLTHQLSDSNSSFKATFIFRFLNHPNPDDDMENFAGFRLGVRVRSNELNSSKINNKGIDAGVTTSGHLFIGKTYSPKKIDKPILTENIRLQLSVLPVSTGGNYAKLKALDRAGNTIATLSSAEYDALAWQGNIALISHCKTNKENTDMPTIAISKFEIEGEKLSRRLKNDP